MQSTDSFIPSHHTISPTPSITHSITHPPQPCPHHVPNPGSTNKPPTPLPSYGRNPSTRRRLKERSLYICSYSYI
ncbi:Protein of unknown function [Pyronema omphalodes CBS 100304]|uniref:Uncharacterized protein n=1 Tax=Pyronema omphalodes (strain CBS 100304) TaxID=1076935 RepID=U4LNK3_PYROM|nr:Protein of unknown function [Pyronema omphalodes CBS 100304]